jgi:hypothetical protein
VGGALRLVIVRRLRARRGGLALTGGAVGVAAALLGSVGIVTTIAREDYTSDHLRRAPPGSVALHAAVGPAQGSAPLRAAARVNAITGDLRDVAPAQLRLVITGPVAPADEQGTRLVRVVAGAVGIVEGRAPRSCTLAGCEALALTGGAPVGQRLRLDALRVTVVGRARLAAWARPAHHLLGARSLVVPAAARLGPVAADAGVWRTTSALVDRSRVRAAHLGRLAGRLEAAVARIRRAGPNSHASGPAPLLRRLDERGRVAQRRMLLISAQAAVLLLAFVAFVASGRALDARRGDDQLILLRAGRRQRAAVRLAEAAVPVLGGVLAATALSLVAAVVVAHRRGLAAGGFVSTAMGAATIAALCAIAAAAIVVILAAERTPAPRSGWAPSRWELGAAVGLAALVWQTASTGGLSAADVAAERNPSPILLLSPALAALAGAAILLRLLPAFLRAAERAARGRGLPVRLALLGAARDARTAAAATVFVAVTLGGGIFALAYRSTLERQGDDAARFRAAATWRALAPANRAMGVTPLTRFADLHPAPVLREPAALGDPTGRTDPNLTLLGIPHAAIPRLTGWRRDFATTPPSEQAAALGRHTAQITGPRIAPAARMLSFWAHTVVESSVTMTVLLAGDRFESLPIANLSTRWHHVTFRVPRRWRGARVVALTFTGVSTIAQDGVEVGPIAQRGGPGTPAQLTSMRDWVASALAGQVLATGLVDAPIPRGVRISFYGVAVPLIRPGYPVPRALPAIVSSRLAKQAVDGQLAIVARGRRIPLDIVGTSDLFPGITTRPEQFAVADYATLLAVLDADAPGDANAQEAWGTSGLAPPRARVENLLPGGHMVTTAAEREVARHDALAVGLDTLLLITAVLAGLLVVAGLALSARRLRGDEQALWREYEALGVRPSVLGRSLVIRALIPLAGGVAGAVVGGVVATRLTASLVALTATGGSPLPPILAASGWVAALLLVGAVAGGAALAARLGAR